ncbi:hypothetical protein HDU67_007005 [Dinochytrium kinnereticum]|nr:hypothetical protein HDU67_007005 [Dinochytrium kinnereticum]
MSLESSFDTFQVFAGNCSAPESTLITVSRARYRSACPVAAQNCLVVAPALLRRQDPAPETSVTETITSIASSSPSATDSAPAPTGTSPAAGGVSSIFARCTPNSNFNQGPFFNDAAVAAKTPYFVFSTFDDRNCKSYSTKALETQHLTALIAGNRCFQIDPRNNATRHTAITCDDAARTITYRDGCDTSCRSCTAAPVVLPYYSCTRNPTDPQTFISGYCTVPASTSALPVLPSPDLAVTTTLTSAVATATTTTVATKGSGATSTSMSNLGRWVVGLVAFAAAGIVIA